MRIGIIGAGMIGGTLARRLAQLGHDVTIANSRGPETLAALAAEVGARAAEPKEAARSGEIVIVTIPERAVKDLPKDLFAGVPDEVVVVDTGNYYPARDGSIPAIEQGQPESAWVAGQIGRPVIKAFNNIFFKSLLEKGRPKDSSWPRRDSRRGRRSRREVEGHATHRIARVRCRGCGRPRRIVAPTARQPRATRVTSPRPN